MTVRVGEGVISNDQLDGAEAGQQLVENALDDGDMESADFGILFCSTDFDMEPFITGVHMVLSELDAEWVGCTAAGELSKQGATNSSAVLLLIDGNELTFDVGVADGIQRHPVSAGAEAAAQVTAAWFDIDTASSDEEIADADVMDRIDEADDTHRILFALGAGQTLDQEERGFDMLRGIVRSAPDVPIVGGTAGDSFRMLATYQFHNGEIYEDAVVLTGISSPYPIKTGMDHGLHDKMASGVVTSTDGNVITEINGEPAATFYADTIGVPLWKLKLPSLPVETIHSQTLLNYLRLWMRGENTIKAQRLFKYTLRYSMAVELTPDRFRIVEPQIITANNGLKMKTQVPENQAIHVVTGDREDIVNAVHTAFEEVPDDDQYTPAFGVFADCIMRRMLLDGDDRDQEIQLLRDTVGCPMIGFYSHGEIGGKSEKFCTFQSQSVTGFVMMQPTDDAGTE